MSSDITYVRTMSINYGEKMDDLQFAKLANELQKKGITIRSHFGSSPQYGFNETTETKKTYQIVMDDKVVFETKYAMDRNEAFDAFSPYLTLESVDAKVDKTSKKWVMVEGSVVEFDLDLEGTQTKWYEYEINYENNQSMAVRFSNSTDGVTLKFTTTWKPKGIQRKDTIEEVMVNETLNDMAKIQGTIESRLKLKKFGFNVDSPSIDCHFDAKTESRSECAPDIINRVKEAKKAHS